MSSSFSLPMKCLVTNPGINLNKLCYVDDKMFTQKFVWPSDSSIKVSLTPKYIFSLKWIFAPLWNALQPFLPSANKSCHFIGFKTCGKQASFVHDRIRRRLGLFLIWHHKLIYIALTLCKLQACKVYCDINSGIDPLPFWLSREQKMLDFSRVLKPIKWQDLLEEEKNGCIAFGRGAKIHCSEKNYFGARGTLGSLWFVLAGMHTLIT